MKSPLVSLLLELENAWKLAGLTFASAVVSMLDVATVALIFPIFLIVISPTEGILPAPFDRIFGDSPDAGTLYILAATLVGVVIVKNGAMALVMRAQTRFAAAGATRLANRLLRGFLRAPLEFHIRRSTSQYIASLRDIPVDIYFLGALSYCNRLAEIMGAALMVLALTLIEPLAIMSAAAVFAALVLLNQRVVSKSMKDWSRQTLILTRKLYGVIGEVFPGIKVVKTTGAEDLLYDQMSRTIEDRASKTASQRLTQMLIRPASEVVMMIAAVIVVSVTLWTKERAVEVIPFLAAFTYAIFRLLPSITRISTYSNEISRVVPMIDSIRADLNETERFAEITNDQTPTMSFRDKIEFRDVHYTYPNDTRPVLKGIDLEIRQGEIIGLAGRSGAGKSTLIDVLLGLLEPTKGTILTDGTPPQKSASHAIGYVPQDTVILNVPIKQNIAFGVPPEHIDDQRVREALKAVGLEDVLASTPEGIEATLGAHGKGLSGGQRQRVGIARALYLEPDLLVLDEATSDLDTTTEHEIASVINGLSGKTTVVMIAHRMHLLKSCDRVFFLSDGQVEAAGDFQQLMSTCPGFAELVSVTERYEHRGSANNPTGAVS